jgi:hypothetical protein
MTDEEKQTTTINQIKQFVLSIISFIVLFFIVFLTGTTLLYSCKVGQANVLPTDKDCFPFTNADADVQKIPINIHNVHLPDNKTGSEKMFFDYQKNKGDSFLSILREINQNPDQSSFVLYFTSILQNVVLFNYQLLNFVLNSLNSNISETAIVFLTPFLLPPLFFFGLVCNWVLFFYNWFAQLGWFFKKNVNQTKEGVPDWKDIQVLEPLRYGFSIFLSFWFIIFAFVLLFIPIPIVIAVFVFIYTLVKPLFAQGEKAEKPYSLFSFMNDTIKYHTSTIMYIMSFLIVLTSFSTFGNIVGFLSLVVFLIFYFKIIPLPLFQEVMPSMENLTTLASYKQAKKICKKVAKGHGSLLNQLTLGLMKGGSNAKFINSVSKILI